MDLRRTSWCLAFLTTACAPVGTECPSPARGEGIQLEVCLPSGSFMMGHAKLPKPTTGPDFTVMPANDWWPQHQVSLGAFYIDAYKVTWGRYARCVAAGVCSRSGLDRMPELRAAFAAPELASHPAEGITFREALDFCLWEGKRLPTEAEWERAARGPGAWDYPWGNAPPSASLLQMPSSAGVLPPPQVDAQPDGASPERVSGLISGDAEWTSDWYDPLFYARSPVVDPRGPSAPVFLLVKHEYGERNWTKSHGGRSVRGWRGSPAGGARWSNHQLGATAWFRGERDAAGGATFRCVRPVRSRPASEEPPAIYTGLTWRPMAAGRSR